MLVQCEKSYRDDPEVLKEAGKRNWQLLYEGLKPREVY